MSIVDPTITDTSGDTLDGAPFLPEEELAAAAAAPTDSDPVVQGIAQNFQNDYPGVEFNILLNGIPASDVQELLVDGQQIPVTDDSGSAETSEPLLVDAGGNLSTQDVQTLDGIIGGYVVPQYAQVEIKTQYDDLYFTLPSEQASSSGNSGTGGAGGGQAPPSSDFFFDGTKANGNSSQFGAVTNVWDMYKADPFTNDRNYEPGVGSKASSDLLSGIVTGAQNLIQQVTGLGADEIINNAWKALDIYLNGGATTIDIVGFSRGGVEALEFLNRIADALKMVSKKPWLPELNAAGGTIGYFTTSNVSVRFVGLFDPVNNFAGAENDKRASIPTSIPIGQIDDAVALDEHRQSFNWVNLASTYSGSNLHMVGFIGAHSDIGGGYPQSNKPGIENYALHWMMTQAESLATNPWTFSTNYSSLAGDYSLSQIHDSYVGIWAALPAIQRNFPASLLCFVPNGLPGTLASLGGTEVLFSALSAAPFSWEDWDPFYDYPTEFPNGNILRAILTSGD
jgi:hypothetical protein